MRAQGRGIAASLAPFTQQSFADMGVIKLELGREKMRKFFIARAGLGEDSDRRAPDAAADTVSLLRTARLLEKLFRRGVGRLQGGGTGGGGVDELVVEGGELVEEFEESGHVGGAEPVGLGGAFGAGDDEP